MYMDTDRRKRVIITSLVVAVVLGLLALILPWNSMYQNRAHASSLPDHLDSVTDTQAKTLTAEGEGKILADMGYLPMRFVVFDTEADEDRIIGDSFVVMWTYCPKPFSFEHCPKQFDADHPFVLTDTQFDALDRNRKDISVTVVGMIAQLEGPTNNILVCKTPPNTTMKQGFGDLKQVKTIIGADAEDGLFHRTYPHASSQKWMCQGSMSTMFQN